MEFADETQQMLTDVENMIICGVEDPFQSLRASLLRLGFGVANRELTKALLKVKSVYNVNGLSQELGRIMLGHTDRMKENVRRLKEQRKKLYGALLKACAASDQSVRHQHKFRADSRGGFREKNTG